MSRRKKLVHHSLRYDRTKLSDGSGSREKAFAGAWEEENEPCGHFPFTHPCSSLEALINNGKKFIPVSQKTATAVATIIQWLGTNVGWCFLVKTLSQAGYIVLTKERYQHLLKQSETSRLA